MSYNHLVLRWKPRESHETLDYQSEQLSNLLKPICEGITLKPWDGNGHFHDRRVLLKNVTTERLVTLDVTAGIDNLMSANKECAVFVDEDKNA